MASIPSNYAINIAKRNEKTGRTEFHSLVELGQVTRAQAVERLEQLREIFGEGYSLELTYWECIGHVIYSDYFGIDKTKEEEA